MLNKMYIEGALMSKPRNIALTFFETVCIANSLCKLELANILFMNAYVCTN